MEGLRALRFRAIPVTGQNDVIQGVIPYRDIIDAGYNNLNGNLRLIRLCF